MYSITAQNTSINVKSARKYDNTYYVWDDEYISETKNGEAVTSNDHWVYRIEKEGDGFYIYDYIPDPAF